MASTGSAESASAATSPDSTELTGRLLLPGSGGRRGVELHVDVVGTAGGAEQTWVLPDDDGRFRAAVPGRPTLVVVSTGSEVLRLEESDLPDVNGRGEVDLGDIDLRDLLVAREVRVSSGDQVNDGLVRVGLWIGPPHRGPQGELPSLGSKQFPSLKLGSTNEWLLPEDVVDIYFLVELPAEPPSAAGWRSGAQQVFGPYDGSAFPLELRLD